MKRFSGFVTFALLTMLIAVPAYAQHPGTPTTDPAASASPSVPGPTNHSMPMMDMCRQMMGDMMAMPMMGGAAPVIPR